jgi:hypothetical protein
MSFPVESIVTNPEFAISRNTVDQIETLLPFLFNVQGHGEAEARNAADALMAVLDATAAIDISDVGLLAVPTEI